VPGPAQVEPSLVMSRVLQLFIGPLGAACLRASRTSRE